MRTYLNRFLFLAALLTTPVSVFAGSATAAAEKSIFSFNPMLVALVSLILILLFAIAVLGNVLRQLTFVYSDKLKDERKKDKGIAKVILFLVAFSLPALSALAGESAVAPVAAPVSNFIDGIARNDFYLLIAFITLELFVILALIVAIRVLIRVIRNRPELIPEAKDVKHSAFWDIFNKAVSIEKEKDILLDHDYDGIRELDNALPPWWKYGFYLTIVVAIIYLYRYQVSGSGPNPEQEYAMEMQEAAEQKAAYLAQSANNIDENSVILSKDPGELAAGQQIFQTTCAACHATDGGGAVGPNLTDDYWLHGGSIKDVFKTIKYGWPDKGMKSWKDDFSPKQIAQLASYVKSLHNTKPAAPKDKQGELFIEGNAAPKPADSADKGKVATK